MVWLPQMYRKDLMYGLHAADIVCAEFEHSWVASGVLYEALVVGRPLLAYREERRYQEEYPELYPIMNAREPESIAARLEEYVDHPEVFQEMGRQGRAWYQEHIVDKALAKYLDYFQGVKTCS